MSKKLEEKYVDEYVFAQNATLMLHELFRENGILTPINTASGCLVNYNNKRFVLTVAHAIATCGKEGSEWGSVLDYNPEYGTKYSTTPPFEFISVSKINMEYPPKDNQLDEILKNAESIDFGYRFAPKDQVFCTMWKDAATGAIDATLKQEFEDFHSPQKDVDYFFYGQTRSKLDDKNKSILSEPRFETCEYLSSSGAYHYFCLPEAMKSAFDYKGCSGAPIFDKDHNLVSLVASAKEGQSFLWGINLTKYAIPCLDASIKVAEFC